MITLRPADTRGHFDFGWLDTCHSFSFGGYQDPAHMRFHALRVLNEDRVQPNQGFGTHGHQDMEILTWVLSGALEHQDSLGSRGVLRPGEAQVMSAGTGIRHSEFNASTTEEVHFLQIWLLPERLGLPPRYGQVAFDSSNLKNRLCLIASRDGSDGSGQIFQDTKIYVARLETGHWLNVDLPPGRAGFLQVATGTISLNGQGMHAGDGARIEGESSLAILAEASAEFLLFDLA